MDYQTNQSANQVVVKKVGLSGGKLAALLIVTILLSVMIGAGSLLMVFHFYPNLTRDTVTNVTKLEKEVTVTDNGIADAVEKVYDSVVVVKTYRQNVLYSTGTGFVYKQENGKYYILTNYHVIENGTKVNVVFTDGREDVVTVQGGDKYSDIAVLTYTTKEAVTISEIGSSAEMRVGDTVFAIGAPLDSEVYSWSVTRGILSGKDRQVEVSTSNSNTSDWIMQVLQTDAAINSGNSGGPLCNSNGQVIGITNMKLITNGVEGMGFAIPIEEATTFADSIIKGEDVSRPFIGISMVDATNSTYASKYGVQAREGVLIGKVEKDSPADKAGLKEGDIIIKMNDAKITGVASLRYQLYKYKVGNTVTIEFIRKGEIKTTKMTLSS